MNRLTVTKSGLTLGPIAGSNGSTKGGIDGFQAMRLSFADGSVLEEVLRHHSDLKISFGKSMRLTYGDQSMEVVATNEIHRSELYKRSDDSSKMLDFIGMFSHSLVVQELDEVSLDESKAKLQKSYELYNDQKAAQTTMIVDSSHLPPPMSGRRAMKKAPYLRKNQKASSRSGPGTPTMKPTRSPLPGSADLTPSADVQIKMEALRIPISHLLALGPLSEHSLAAKTRASEDLCAKVLGRIGKKVAGGRQWELLDDIYKELDLWDFPYIASKDREKAIQNSREAFQRIRLNKDAPEWRLLLSPDDREKADAAREAARSAKPAASRAIPKSMEDSGRSPPTKPLTTKKLADDISKPVPPKTAKAAQNDTISRIIGGKKKKTPAKPKGGPIGRPPKAPGTSKAPKAAGQRSKATNVKYISAETVDSDEDEIMEDVPPIPPPKPVELKAPSPPQRKPASKAPSIAGSDMERDSGHRKTTTIRTPIPSTAKSPIKKPRPSAPSSTKSTSPTPSLKAQFHTTKPLISSSKDSRSSSNSPPKPSPLGSSPPINASEIVSSSTSSPYSGAGLSTASASPLDGASNRRRTAASALKRKAVEVEDRKAAKRHSPDGPDSYTIRLARQFKEQYANYEKLYREAQMTTDEKRKKEKIEKVLTLHKDLENLKTRISMAV